MISDRVCVKFTYHKTNLKGTMLLTIDIGNTNLTLGLYREQGIIAHWRLATVHERMPDEYGLQFLGMLAHSGFSPSDLTGICMASVVPPRPGKFRMPANST